MEKMRMRKAMAVLGTKKTISLIMMMAMLLRAVRHGDAAEDVADDGAVRDAFDWRTGLRPQRSSHWHPLCLEYIQDLLQSTKSRKSHRLQPSLGKKRARQCRTESPQDRGTEVGGQIHDPPTIKEQQYVNRQQGHMLVEKIYELVKKRLSSSQE